MKAWIANHPNIWEFILFNELSNVSTAANFVVMWMYRLCILCFEPDTVSVSALPLYECGK